MRKSKYLNRYSERNIFITRESDRPRSDSRYLGGIHEVHALVEQEEVC